MLKRLFVKLPLYIVFFVSCVTIIIPIVYWVITGREYIEIVDEIEDL